MDDSMHQMCVLVGQGRQEVLGNKAESWGCRTMVSLVWHGQDRRVYQNPLAGEVGLSWQGTGHCTGTLQEYFYFLAIEAGKVLEEGDSTSTPWLLVKTANTSQALLGMKNSSCRMDGCSLGAGGGGKIPHGTLECITRHLISLVNYCFTKSRISAHHNFLLSMEPSSFYLKMSF